MSQKKTKSEIELISISKVIPYVRNSRTHSPNQVKQIAASNREFGFTNPILIDEVGTIIAGHGRVLAAEHLQMTEIPAIRLSHLTEAQKRAYVIADNKLALNAEWDEEMLKIELSDLHDDGYNLEVIGFSADELNLVMNGWDSDIDLHDRHGSNLDGIESLIKISIEQDQKADALSQISKALDEAGIEYEIR